MSRQVTGRTGLLCLLGSPVAHSISPAMHNEACALLDLDYTYLAFDVAPDRLAEAVEGLKALGVRGFNVTMPHKTAAAALCERLSPAARICGAVNTVVNEGGSLVGHTTDGEGYMRSAREAGFQPEGKRMVQLGAGGAGTAVLVQAALDGMAASTPGTPSGPGRSGWRPSWSGSPSAGWSSTIWTTGRRCGPAWGRRTCW